MGCDIHAYVEYETKPNGAWWFFADVDLPRNYRMFAALAGVRDYEDDDTQGTPHVKPRGLPVNASNRVVRESEEISTDGHSRTWLSLEEYRGALQVYTERTPQAYGVSFEFSIVEKLMAALDESGVEARIVFWFDN